MIQFGLLLHNQPVGINEEVVLHSLLAESNRDSFNENETIRESGLIVVLKKQIVLNQVI